MGFVPVMPSFGLNVLVHIAIDEHRLGMVPPRSSQIEGVRRCTSGQATIDEDQSMVPSLLRRSCSEIAMIFGKDFAIFKNSGCPTENKIHGTFNITFFVILTGAVSLYIQCILITQKPTIFKNNSVRRYTHCNGLPHLSAIPCIVLKGDALGLEAFTKHKKG